MGDIVLKGKNHQTTLYVIKPGEIIVSKVKKCEKMPLKAMGHDFKLRKTTFSEVLRTLMTCKNILHIA